MLISERNGLPYQTLAMGDNRFNDYLRQGSMAPHQFYNTALSTAESNWIRLAGAHKFMSTQGKIINKTYYDIETYVKEDGSQTPFNAQYSYYPVNSIALYNNVTNTAYILVWLQPFHNFTREELIREIRRTYLECVEENNTYLVEGLEIELETFNDEFSLLKRHFALCRDLNNHVLMGFNSDNFDDPYTIKRVQKNTEAWQSVVSEFGQVKSFGELSFEFPDYNMVDLQKQYRPVDAGGSGYGSSLPSYSLNSIASHELGITKLDLDEDFVYSYENNLINYLTYNMLDTLITYKLDLKLGFIEQIFALSTINNAPLGSTIRGRSLMFSYRNNQHFMNNNVLLNHRKYGSDVYYGTDDGKKK